MVAYNGRNMNFGVDGVKEKRQASLPNVQWRVRETRTWDVHRAHSTFAITTTIRPSTVFYLKCCLLRGIWTSFGWILETFY